MNFYPEKRVLLPANNALVAPNARTLLVAGPCVFEGDDILGVTLEGIQRAASDAQIPFVLKTSYFKANRSSVGAFESLCGSDKFAALLLFLSTAQKLKNENADLAITTDFHSAEDILPAYLAMQKAAFLADPARMEAVPAAYRPRIRALIDHTDVTHWWDAVDILQVPAFLSLQNDVLRTAAATGKIVSVKKHQTAPIEQFREIVKIFQQAGNPNILPIDRGTLEGDTLSVDAGHIGFLQRKLNVPALVDITHAVKGLHNRRDAAGAYDNPSFRLLTRVLEESPAGIFMEVHPRPSAALSDGAAQIPLSHLRLFTDRIAASDAARKSYPLDPGAASLANDFLTEKTRVFVPPSQYRAPDVQSETGLLSFLEDVGDTTYNLFYPSLFQALQTGREASLRFSDHPARGGYLSEAFGPIRINTFIKNTTPESLALLKERSSFGEINIAYFSNLDFMNANLPEAKRATAQEFLKVCDVIACRTEGQKDLIAAWLEREGLNKEIVVYADAMRGSRVAPAPRLADLSEKGTASKPFKLRASCYPVHLESYLAALRDFASAQTDLHVNLDLMTSGIRPDQKANIDNQAVIKEILALSNDKLRIRIVPYSKAAQETFLVGADAVFIDPDVSDNAFNAIWLNRNVKGVNRTRAALWKGVPVVAIGANGLEGFKACWTGNNLGEALLALRQDRQIVPKIEADQTFLAEHLTPEKVFEDRQRRLSQTQALRNHVSRETAQEHSRLRAMIEMAKTWNMALQPLSEEACCAEQLRRDLRRFERGLTKTLEALAPDGSAQIQQMKVFREALEETAEQGGKLILTGAGKSADVAKVAAQAFLRAGYRVRVFTTEDLTCGDLAQIEPGDTVLTISKSGSTPLSLIEETGARPFLLTHAQDGKNVGYPTIRLPSVAEIGLGRREEDLVLAEGMTPSVSVLLDLLALETLASPNATGVAQRFEQAREEIAALLASPKEMTEAYVSMVGKLKATAQNTHYTIRPGATDPETVLMRQILFTYAHLRHDPTIGKDIEGLFAGSALASKGKVARFALLTSLAGQNVLGRDLTAIERAHPTGSLRDQAGRALATIRAMEEVAKHPFLTLQDQPSAAPRDGIAGTMQTTNSVLVKPFTAQKLG